MKLVADAGSTKVEWALISDAPSAPVIFSSSGFNPALVPTDHLVSDLSTRLLSMPTDVRSITQCHYYGAGCLPHIIPEVQRALTQILPNASVSAYSDMLGAARALFPCGSGIACILGTGSNSALITDGQITDHIPPLGYILGDEGSGAALGRRLLGDMYKRLLPATVVDEWQRQSGLDYSCVVERVYRRPDANKFLASLTRFISDNIRLPEIRLMVVDEMGRFIDRNVMRYPRVQSLPVGFAGSLASVFAAELEEAASARNIQIHSIITRPIEGLIEYHSIH